MGTILEEIERMVSKPPEERSDDEVNKLLPWFRKKSDVFGSLKPDAVVDIIRNCELIRRSRDNIIIKQGEKGNCFFIVLSGKVSVHISIKDDDDDADEENKIQQSEAELTHALGLPYKRRSIDRVGTAFLNKTAGTMSSIRERGQATKADVTDQSVLESQPVIEAFQRSNTKVVDKPRYGQYVATIGDGKSFGELALLKRDCIRNATIITESNTRLLMVNRQLYNRCIRESQEKEFQAKQLFVHTSEYFEGWTLKSKRQFAMSLQLRTYSYGTPVVCQGQPLDYIYFLQSGQCRVIINPSLHRSQYPSYHGLLNQLSSASCYSLADECFPRRIIRRGRKKGYAMHGYDICLIGSYNMIGDIELTNGLPTYMQTVICEQQTEAFVIDLRNYDRLVTKRHAFTGRLIAQNALLKLSNRALRFQHIPLLTAVVRKSSGQLQDDRYKQHYIAHQRQRQLNKAKFVTQHSLPLVNKVENRKVEQSNDETKERLPLCTMVAQKSVPPPRYDTVKLHLREEQRMNKLEDKILAFHGKIERESVKTLSGPVEQVLESLEPQNLGIRSCPHACSIKF